MKKYIMELNFFLLFIKYLLIFFKLMLTKILLNYFLLLYLIFLINKISQHLYYFLSLILIVLSYFKRQFIYQQNYNLKKQKKIKKNIFIFLFKKQSK